MMVTEAWDIYEDGIYVETQYFDEGLTYGDVIAFLTTGRHGYRGRNIDVYKHI